MRRRTEDLRLSGVLRAGTPFTTRVAGAHSHSSHGVHLVARGRDRVPRARGRALRRTPEHYCLAGGARVSRSARHGALLAPGHDVRCRRSAGCAAARYFATCADERLLACLAAGETDAVVADARSG